MCRLFAAIAIIVLFAASSMFSAQAQPSPKGKLPGGVTPTHYTLELEVSPKTDRFSGRVQIDITLDNPTQIIWLHGRDLKVSDAYVLASDGVRIDAVYSQVEDTGVVKVTTKQTIGPGSATLVIRYSAPFNQSLEGLFNVKKGEQYYAYTQFQPLRARRAFPSFDEPRFKTPFDITLTIDENHRAVSNAPEHKTVKLNDGRRRVIFQTTKPLPTYLVAIAVGDFDIVEWEAIPPNAVRSFPIPLRGIAPKGKGKQLAYALKHTQAMLKILEEYFQIPYPYAKLDLVAVSDFSPGGMENAGAIFYRQEKILLGARPSVYQIRDYAYIHAHELAHSWFGNLVTPVWWDDLWLNEAFATWMSDRVVNQWRPDEFDNRGPIRRGKQAVRSDRLVSARQIRQPIKSNNDISNAFDSITYSKGGAVLAMIERYMGAEKFRDGVRLFMQRHAHGVASAENFFTALSEVSSRPGVIEAIESFLQQPGIPLVSARWSCNTEGETQITLKQSRSLPLGSKGDPEKKWSIPICLTYLENGKRKNHCILMAKPQTIINLATNSCPAWVLPNQDGAAYLNFTLSRSRWNFLISKMGQLPPGEALAFLNSLEAAYNAGEVTTEQIFSAAKMAAQSKYWDVVQAPIQILRNIKLFVVPNDQQPAVRAMMRRIYKPALARFDLSDTALGAGETTNARALLRGDLIWFMALDARHKGLRTRLNRLGQAYMGYGTNGKVNREVLHPNLVRTALIVATEETGPGFMEVLIDRLKQSDDAVMRAHIVRVLGYQTEAGLVARVGKLILNPQISKRTSSELLRRQSHMVANREVLFSWIKAHYDELLKRLPRSHRRWLPWRSANFCDEKSAGYVEEFYSARVKKLRGGPRILANVVETMEICAAIAQMHRKDALQALAIAD